MTRKEEIACVEEAKASIAKQTGADWNTVTVWMSPETAGALLRLARSALDHPAWGPCKTCEFCRVGCGGDCYCYRYPPHHRCGWTQVEADNEYRGCGEHKERGE